MSVRPRGEERTPHRNRSERTFQGLIACRGYRRTWAFPREVNELLQRETDGRSVLHLFGGQSEWGLRLDADRATKPHVVGNAFFPPFACSSFDVVICDPPYDWRNSWSLCLKAAACLARSEVWWFSTDCLGRWEHRLKLLAWWVVMASPRGPLRYLSRLERTSHPPSCARHADRFRPSVRKYDWRSHVKHPNLPLGVA